ncbi:hypothetical protein WA158_000985 [Blastocystis sp. Blastoise]
MKGNKKNKKQNKKPMDKKSSVEQKKATQQVKPKQIVPENESDSESSSGDEEYAIRYDKTIKENKELLDEIDSESSIEETNDIEFVFTDPKEDDFKAVRTFIQSGLLSGSGKDIDFSPLSDYICDQPEVGCMVKVADEEDVYGFMTILNACDIKDKCFKPIYNILKNNCPDSNKTQFNQLMSDKTTGILINERMINFPPQLIPNMFSSIHEDIKWATTDKDVQNKELFKFKTIIVISPCYKPANEKKNKKQKNQTENQKTLFSHFEDEAIQNHAIMNFSFGVKQMVDSNLSESIPQSRKVMAFNLSDMDTIIQEITAMLI